MYYYRLQINWVFLQTKRNITPGVPNRKHCLLLVSMETHINWNICFLTTVLYVTMCLIFFPRGQCSFVEWNFHKYVQVSASVLAHCISLVICLAVICKQWYLMLQLCICCNIGYDILFCSLKPSIFYYVYTHTHARALIRTIYIYIKRGPLSLVNTIEEPLGRKISSSSLENWEYGRRDSSRWPRGIPYP
jgi:hypothetical protein